MNATTKSTRAMVIIGLVLAQTLHSAHAQAPSQAEIGEAFKATRPDKVDAYRALVHAAYYLKQDSLPTLPRKTRSNDLINSLKSWKPYYDPHGLDAETESIPRVETAKAILDGEAKRLSQPKEEAVLKNGTLSPGNLQWEILRTEADSHTEGAREYDYAFRLQGSPGNLHLDSGLDFLSDSIEAQEYSDRQLDEDTFAVAWANPQDLVSIHWANKSMFGSGQYTDQTCLLLKKTQAGWREIYRHVFNCFGKLGGGTYYSSAEDFKWDAARNVLTIRHEDRHVEEWAEPGPLSARSKEGGGGHTLDVTTISERLYRINGTKLEFLEGKRLVDPGKGTFKVADIPRYYEKDKTDPATVVARIRKLNPKLGKSEEFSGPLVIETGILAKDKDENE